MLDSQTDKDPVRDEILTKSKELFKRFGFKKTTMEEIANQIGKSKSSLYYYYKTKEEIFEAVAWQDMLLNRVLIQEALDRESSCEKKFIALVTATLGYVNEKSNQYSIIRAELFETMHLVQNLVNNQRDHYVGVIKNLVILGIASGEVRLMTSLEIDVWSESIHFMLKSIGENLFCSDKYNFIGEKLDFLAQRLFDGIKKQD